MEEETARRLIRLNNGFYRDQATSFSATRMSAWQGWDRVLVSLDRPPRTVIDLACGNMRFLPFLEERFGRGTVDYHGVDSCREFATGRPGATFHELDILQHALDGGGVRGAADLPPCDLLACFGFMHHVPGRALRRQVLCDLLGLVKPGGIAAVSFWRFADVSKLAQRAEATTRAAGALADDLDPGDYLVGWNDLPGVYRFCHSFSDDDIDALAKAASSLADVADRFSADGRNGAMNGYLVFRRR